MPVSETENKGSERNWGKYRGACGDVCVCCNSASLKTCGFLETIMFSPKTRAASRHSFKVDQPFYVIYSATLDPTLKCLNSTGSPIFCHLFIEQELGS